MPDNVPLPAFGCRFAALLTAERRQRGVALIVPAEKRSALAAIPFSGGRDVKYVVVVRQAVDDASSGVIETVTYREDIPGTDLVYDLTGEFLQGKARPFQCDLRKLPARVYALLPFQVEAVIVKAAQQVSLPKKPEKGAAVACHVEFQDGRGERIQGFLPFNLKLISPAGHCAYERYLVTDERGRCDPGIPLPPEAATGKWQLIARSQLTGEEVTLPIKVLAHEERLFEAATRELTSLGRTARLNSQPVEP